MKLKKILLAVATTLPVFCAPAYAGLQVDDWTLNTGAIGLAAESGGTGNIVVNNIDEILFNAVTHAVSPAGIAPGNPFFTSGLGIATDFKNYFSGLITPVGLNSTWELSFAWTAGGQYTTVAPPNVNFAHAGPFATGSILFYIDDITDGSKATPGNGAGYTDGTLFATFDLTPNWLSGGGLNLLTSDGSDDADWLINVAGTLAGVILNKAGVLPADLGQNDTTDLHTDSNFDANPIQGTPAFSYVAGGFNCGQNQNDFCAEEDGSAVVTVPEPATLALLGLGLAGMGVFGGRRNKKA